jgi:hypothetical protein
MLHVIEVKDRSGYTATREYDGAGFGVAIVLDRALKDVRDYPSASIEEVWIEARPEWRYDVSHRRGSVRLGL